jgi:hypothetical protein
MTNLVSHGALPEVQELILILRYERPIPAADFGALFRAFATDYGRLNKGRTLVIAAVETGSIIVHLRDAYEAIAPYVPAALELAKIAKNLKEFVEVLRTLFASAKADPKRGGLFQKKRSPGIKSAEQMAKMVIASGGEVELHHKQPDGEKISVKLTSLEAIRIREQAAISRRAVSSSAPGQLHVESHAPVPYSGLAHYSFHDAGRIADNFVAAGTEAEAIIGVVASVLRELNMDHVLEAVAAELDERGHHSLAMAVRANQSNRGSAPPAHE